MSKLFIYYSHTGNGDVVSELFKEHNYVLRKVNEKRKMPKSFFAQMMVGGFRASIGAKGKLVNYDNNICDFDEIVIGSPIWNGRFPPAINTVLSNTDFNGKSITFVFYSGSGTGPKAKEKAQKLFPECKILFLKEPKKYKDELKKLDELF